MISETESLCKLFSLYFSLKQALLKRKEHMLHVSSAVTSSKLLLFLPWLSVVDSVERQQSPSAYANRLACCLPLRETHTPLCLLLYDPYSEVLMKQIPSNLRKIIVSRLLLAFHFLCSSCTLCVANKWALQRWDIEPALLMSQSRHVLMSDQSTLSPLSKPYAPLIFPTVWTPHSSKLSYCVCLPSSQHVRLSTSAVVLVIEWSWSLICLRNVHVSPSVAHWVTTSLSMSPTALYSWRPTR